jgi:hypothetical protein
MLCELQCNAFNSSRVFSSHDELSGLLINMRRTLSPGHWKQKIKEIKILVFRHVVMESFNRAIDIISRMFPNHDVNDQISAMYTLFDKYDSILIETAVSNGGAVEKVR